MAPTSEERREVAERLRELDHEITSYDTIESGANKLEKAVYGNTSFSPIEYSVRNLCGLANTLADLIDPQERTCHFVFRDESYSTPDGYEQDGTYYCSACGCDLPDWMQEHVDDIQAGKIENDIARCPICGARLVSK